MQKKQKNNRSEKKLFISDHSPLPLPPPGFPERILIDFAESMLPSAPPGAVCPFVRLGGVFPPHISRSNNTLQGYFQLSRYPTRKRRFLRCGTARGNCSTRVY